VPKVRRPATGAGIPDAGRRHPAHSASPSAARAAAAPGSGAGATAAGALGVTLGGGAPPLEPLAATGRPRKAGGRLERDVQASLGASFTVQGMSQGPPGPPPTPALARNRAPMPPMLLQPRRTTARTCCPSRWAWCPTCAKPWPRPPRSCCSLKKMARSTGWTWPCTRCCAGLLGARGWWRATTTSVGPRAAATRRGSDMECARALPLLRHEAVATGAPSPAALP